MMTGVWKQLQAYVKQGMAGRGASRRVYLDYAAATPLSSAAERAMRPYQQEHFGNPSAIHIEGRIAREAIESAREQVARTLGVRTSGVTFTGSGTESNTLALWGHVAALEAAGTDLGDIEIVATKVEHQSILATLAELQVRGVVVHYAPVNEGGLVVISKLASLLTAKTRLVTIAYANSETGVVQNVRRLARTIQAAEKETGTKIVLHTDASQAPLWLPCQLPPLGVDLMTLDAGKCGGPKGVGLLVQHGSVLLQAVIRGGGQEQGLRAGTENTVGIVGAATAIKEAQGGWRSRSVAVGTLRDRLRDQLLMLPGAVSNGSRKHRLPNNVNISLLGLDTEYAAVVLDAHGISASTKSACSGAGGGVSSVVEAMTGDSARAASTLRFTLGPGMTATELDRVVEVLREHIQQMSEFTSSRSTN